MKFLIVAFIVAASIFSVTASHSIESDALDTVYDWKAAFDASSLPLVNATLLSEKIEQSNLIRKGRLLGDFADMSIDKYLPNSYESTRVIGSKGHAATIQWLNESMSNMFDYYNVYCQKVEFGPVPVRVSLQVFGETHAALGFLYSPGGIANSTLAYVSNFGCDASHFTNVTGKIVLANRGGCEYGTKSSLAGAAGAVGLIISNVSKDNLEGHSLGSAAHLKGSLVPTISINEFDGLKLRSMLDGGIEVPVFFKLYTKMIETHNVIAQTKLGDPDNVLHIGAHSDSVAAGMGFNDNGSGTIAILEVAEQLVNYKIQNAVRFSWWTAEEQGLVGSNHYVNNLTDSELSKIRLYLNFDMLASPNYIFGIYDGAANSPGSIPGPPGSAEAQSLFEFFYLMSDETYVNYRLLGTSDYRAFLLAGIPVGGITTGAQGIKTIPEADSFGGMYNSPYDPNYHKKGDKLWNSSHKAWLLNTKAVAYAVGTWAKSWEHFPKANGTIEGNSAEFGKWKPEEGMMRPVHLI